MENAAATPVALQVWEGFVRRAVPRRPRALTWAMHDWLALSRALPGLTSCASTEAGEMHVVRTLFTQSDTAVVLSSPHLINAVIGRLRNKGYVKLCGDGTFRLIRGGWVLISIGVLTKRYSPAENDDRSRVPSTHWCTPSQTKSQQPRTEKCSAEHAPPCRISIPVYSWSMLCGSTMRIFMQEKKAPAGYACRSPSKLRTSHISLARHPGGKRHRSRRKSKKLGEEASLPLHSEHCRTQLGSLC